MGLGTPAYCLRFASPAEANGKLENWRNRINRKCRITLAWYMCRTNVVAEDVFSRNQESPNLRTSFPKLLQFDKFNLFVTFSNLLYEELIPKLANPFPNQVNAFPGPQIVILKLQNNVRTSFCTARFFTTGSKMNRERAKWSKRAAKVTASSIKSRPECKVGAVWEPQVLQN